MKYFTQIDGLGASEGGEGYWRMGFEMMFSKRMYSELIWPQ